MKADTEQETKRSLAKVTGGDLWLDNGCILLDVTFEYEDGGCQGLGYIINDTSFVKRFMRVFRVDHLSQVNGRSCWVDHSHNGITAIHPLHRKDGEAFDIKEWSREQKANGK